jgi:exosortase
MESREAMKLIVESEPKRDTSNRGKAARLGYVQILQIGSVLLLLVLLYFRIIQNLAADWWNDESASHGMLIPPLVLYLAWLKRDEIRAVPAVLNMRGLWVVTFGCLVYLVGRLGAEFFLSRMSLVILFTGLIWTFWGSGRLKELGFPLLLLATMVPLPTLVWNALAAPLQLFASDISTSLAQWLGVAVYRDGNVIHLAQLSLGVAEACSGLHSLSALMIASLLLGFLQCTAVVSRVVIFFLSIPLAIALNVVRITGTAVISDYWQDAAFGFYHSFSGWLVFVLGFGVLWFIARAARGFEKA